MCYSAEASFALGATLFPIGAYCLRSAWIKNRRLLPLAVIPIGLGVQQVSEGYVWLALNAGDTPGARPPGLVFLFFALALWPFWSPVQAAISETRPTRRVWLVAFTVLASGWFWLLFYPLLTDPDKRLTPVVTHHSIRYAITLPVDDYVPRTLVRIVYLISIVLPLVIGPRLFGPIPGLLLAASAVVTAVVFEYAFASVWCFFAAIVSLGLGYIFARLPSREPIPDRLGT